MSGTEPRIIQTISHKYFCLKVTVAAVRRLINSGGDISAHVNETSNACASLTTDRPSIEIKDSSLRCLLYLLYCIQYAVF